MSPRAQLWTVLLAAAVGLGGCGGGLRWNTRSDQTHRPAPAEAGRAGEYRVEKGDTLYGIAFRNQLDFRELARWNGIGGDYTIHPGQRLRLRPPAGERAAPQTSRAPPPPERRPEQRPSTPRARPPAVASAPAGPMRFEWRWPLNGSVSRNYAPAAGNKGLDFTGVLGMPVLAAAPGKVVYSGNALKGYGELIIIKHDDTYLSAYAYNRRRLVKEGDVVTGGQPIAELGLGPQNKPLLHFEIRANGKPVNPLDYLPSQDRPSR
ncbi:MAG TPA: peptidoglycan DD-metalloendopeptidase family protein [Stenotrophobium sp.]|jgi:lipoprotein NlpD|nr:peptidoglycan DD-metalloendopeptidase family protein [Stenotrophobium sp.]